jgi:hypothetical protein
MKNLKNGSLVEAFHISGKRYGKIVGRMLAIECWMVDFGEEFSTDYPFSVVLFDDDSVRPLKLQTKPDWS